MNPTKLVATPIEVETISAEIVASTVWFNFAKKTPGQPGVFEVNPIKEFDNDLDSPCRRFSFWNGSSFAAISCSVDGAYRERFNFSSLIGTISTFRGLVEEA